MGRRNLTPVRKRTRRSSLGPATTGTTRDSAAQPLAGGVAARAPTPGPSPRAPHRRTTGSTDSRSNLPCRGARRAPAGGRRRRVPRRSARGPGSTRAVLVTIAPCPPPAAARAGAARGGPRPTATPAHRRRDVGGRARRRPRLRHGRRDRPAGPARTAAVVAAQGPHRGRARPRSRRRCARSRRRPASSGAWSHRWAPSTSGSSPRTAASTRPCTTSSCGPSAASCPTTTSRSPRWRGCRWASSRSRLAYADERRLIRRATELLEETA